MRHVIGRTHGAGKDCDYSTTHLIAALFLRARPPVGEEDEEVGCADGAIVVEVSGTTFARTPTAQE